MAKKRKAKPNRNKAKPPEVIHLPEDMIISYDETDPHAGDTAALTAFNSDGSNDLMAAANDPGAALRETYDDIPAQPDAEIAATAILDAEIEEVTTEEVDRPTIKALLATPVSSPETNFANASFTMISEGSAALVDGIKALGSKLAALPHRLHIRAVAAGNDFVDWLKKTGNEAWAAYDAASKAYNEKPFGFHVWLMNTQRNIDRYFADREAKKMALYMAMILEPMDELLASMRETFKEERKLYKAEISSLSKRIDSLEKEFRTREKKQNNVINDLSNKVKQAVTVDPKLLDEFGYLIANGRKTNATNMYAKLTGVSLAEAKKAVAEIAT